MRTFVQFAILAVTFIVVMIPQLLHAFVVDIPNDTFFPDQNENHRYCLITNTDKKKHAVIIYVQKRDQDLKGTDIRTDCENDFLVVPRQIVLNPGQCQKINLVWHKKIELIKELSYQVIVEELPIRLDTPPIPDKLSFPTYIVRKVVSNLYVSHKYAASNVIIDSIKPVKIKKNQYKMELVFYNEGTSHEIMENIELTIWPATDPELAIVIQPDFSIQKFNVLAGNKRRFLLEWPKQLATVKVLAIYRELEY